MTALSVLARLLTVAPVATAQEQQDQTRGLRALPTLAEQLPERVEGAYRPGREPDIPG